MNNKEFFEPVKLVAVSATQNVGGNAYDNYMNAEGAEIAGDEFFNAGGLFSGMKKRKDQRQKRRDLRTKSKAEARLIKAGAKEKNAQAQVESAKAMSTSAASDGDLAKALAGKKQKGMSAGVKIAIGVGVAAVLGLVVFFVIKKKKK